MNRLGMCREAATLIIVPAGLCIAWKQWIKSSRAALPAWRNGLGLAGLVILSISWVATALVDLPMLAHPEAVIFPALAWITFHLAHTIDVAALLLAIALTGRSRMAAALSAIVMLTCWPGGYT